MQGELPTPALHAIGVGNFVFVSRGTRIVLMVSAVVAVAAIAVFGLAGSKQPAAGRAAPALPTAAIVGPRVTVAQLTGGAGGHAALVVFWASWCGPCQQEAPGYARLATGAGRGHIVGVDWSDGEAGAKAFVRHYGWSFPNLRDGDGSVGAAYRITGLPTTFVLGRGGGIRAVLRGPQDEAALAHALAAAERPA
jgi:thiol-disulfide isomerase/thioredoxin